MAVSRIVLDTNQLVAALARPPELATFIMSWESRRFVVAGSQPMLDEYDYVLAYPNIAALVYPELLRAFRSHLLQEIELIELPNVSPICRDPDDDKIIATAIYGLADFLVTEDADLQTAEVKRVLASSGVEVISVIGLMRELDKAF